ncbi:MAG: hypothetical protein EBX39_10950, partial [Actinobacteria bacterium]|nr:hypothetical protein [Actinomycetota bacterium]
MKSLSVVVVMAGAVVGGVVAGVVVDTLDVGACVVLVVVAVGSTMGAVPRKMSKIGCAATVSSIRTLIAPTMVP